MATTPKFIISAAGLAAASVATPQGPYIEITKFAVGSAYGYAPDPDVDTGLTGNKLYEGTIAAYAYMADNTINIICRLPPDAGPFDFGEVALYLADGTMFAKAAFNELQSKYSSLGTSLALTYTFNCLLKLEQSLAVFKIVTSGSGSGTGGSSNVVTVERWTDVIPPGLSADPDNQYLLVKELTNRGDATLLIQSTDMKWTPSGTYYPLGSFSAKDASATWVEIAVADWPYAGDGELSAIEQASILLETEDGFFRSVSMIQHVGSPVTGIRFLLNPEPFLNVPIIGDTLLLHINDAAVGSLMSRSTGDSWNINISGNADTADYADTAGTANLAPNYLPLAGANMTGNFSVKDKRWPWGPTFSAVDFGNGGAYATGPGIGTFLAQNLYHDGSTWRTKAAGVGAIFAVQANGTQVWYYTATAAAGAAVTPVANLVLDVTGNLTATNNVSGYSDVRLKKDIQPIDNALAKVQGLHGVTFERIGFEGRRQTGLIAQDVAKVLPEAVIVDNDSGMMSITYGNVVGLLTEAIKELHGELAEVKSQLANALSLINKPND